MDILVPNSTQNSTEVKLLRKYLFCQADLIFAVLKFSINKQNIYTRHFLQRKTNYFFMAGAESYMSILKIVGK